MAAVFYSVPNKKNVLPEWVRRSAAERLLPTLALPRSGVRVRDESISLSAWPFPSSPLSYTGDYSVDDGDGSIGRGGALGTGAGIVQLKHMFGADGKGDFHLIAQELAGHFSL